MASGCPPILVATISVTQSCRRRCRTRPISVQVNQGEGRWPTLGRARTAVARSPGGSREACWNACQRASNVAIEKRLLVMEKIRGPGCAFEGSPPQRAECDFDRE